MEKYNRRRFIKFTGMLLPGVIIPSSVLALMDNSSDSTSRVKELIESARRGDLRRVEALYHAGVPIDACMPNLENPEFHESALHVACEMDHEHIVEYLLKKGAIVDNWGTGAFKQTPIFYARSPEVMELLFNAGADINAVDSGEIGSVLVSNINEKRFPNFKYLLDHGADFESEKNCGSSVLMIAISWNGGLAQIKELLRRGATLGSHGNEVLTESIREAIGTLASEVNFGKSRPDLRERSLQVVSMILHEMKNRNLPKAWIKSEFRKISNEWADLYGIDVALFENEFLGFFD